MNDKELLKKVSNYDLLEELRSRLLINTNKATSISDNKYIQGAVGEVINLQGQTGEYKLIKLTNLETILAFGDTGKDLQEGNSYDFEIRVGKNNSNILISSSLLI